MGIKKPRTLAERGAINERIIYDDFDQAGVQGAALKTLGGGGLVGFADVFNKKISRMNWKPTKLTKATRLGGIVLAAHGISEGYRTHKNLKTKLGRETHSPLTNAIASPLAGAFIGTLAAGAALVKLNSLASVAKAARSAKAANAARVAKLPRLGKIPKTEVMSKGQMVWRRIRGRIIPIRMKTVGPNK